MAIRELDITFGTANGGLVDGTNLGIFQKMVNLSSGKRHTLMAVDLFNDSLILDQFPQDVLIEFFVSAQPLIYSK